MIKYSLNCKNCNLTFESWFANSKEYEKLKKKNFLNCHNCNSYEVEKSLMAPSLINKNYDSKNYEDQKNMTKLKKPFQNIKNLLKTILNMLEIILPMRHDLFITIIKKKQKGIYGTASKQELKELKEEGIDAQMIPWLEDKSN